MFRGLHLRLTLLYACATLALLAGMGGGGYLVLTRYFEQITDFALAHKMAHEFHRLAAPLPPSLLSADRDWSIIRAQAEPLRPAAEQATLSRSEALQVAQAAYPQRQIARIWLHDDAGTPSYIVQFTDGTSAHVDATNGRLFVPAAHAASDEQISATPISPPTLNPLADLGSAAYDAELAAIFVLPLDQQGNLLFDPNPAAAPILPDQAALAAALRTGYDLRTIQGTTGEQVRLLTYRLTRDDGPAALQLGRVLTDQAEVLAQLGFGLSMIGALSVIVVGLSSWWIAGRALQPAQQAWERQQQFVASASHELRTPLTLIRASSEVALRSLPPDATDQRELLTDVLSEADHMRHLVDDLLTLSRLDAGKLSLERELLAVNELFSMIERQMGRIASEQQVQLQVTSTADTVYADAERLRQVLLILLDNALRYTPPGGVISLAAYPHGQQVRISVQDTGSGIAPEHLAHLFERFYRADTARGGGTGNTGLGLAIAQALVQAHGGQIQITSTLGAGTCVTLDLPASTRTHA